MYKRQQQESTGQTMETEAPKTKKQETTEEGRGSTDSGKGSTGTASSKITEEEAKSIAFQDAGIEEAQVTGVRVHPVSYTHLGQ